MLIGLVAGAACYWGATGLKRWLRADDSLDVFGVHGVGGIVGALMTGLLADPRVGGVTGSLGTQALAVVATLAFSALMTAGILMLVHLLMGGLRVDAAREQQGLDLSQHGEQVA